MNGERVILAAEPAGPRSVTARPLHALAWGNVVLHVIGLGLAAYGMRPGSPLAPLDDRLRYLAAQPAGWTAGWAVWMVCAVAFVAYLAYLSHLLGPSAWLARLGLMLALVAAGFDLFCDTVYILIFPALAAQAPGVEPLFLTLERITGIGSLVIANGGYSAGILLIVHAQRGWDGVGPWTTGLGFGVGGCGLLLAAAGFTGDPWHAAVATLPTIGLFCVWTVLVARAVEPPRRAP